MPELTPEARSRLEDLGLLGSENPVVRIFGTSDDDILTGTDRSDEIFGREGNDIISSSLSIDYINAGAGDDIAFGGEGNDIIIGGSGNDQLFGDEGNDTINGRSDKDQIFGGLGDDKIRGGSGNDQLIGGQGNDRLEGGRGRDRLIGVDTTLGLGMGEIDTLTGEQGNDTFVLGIKIDESNVVFYNDRDSSSAGISDYALIADFGLSRDNRQLGVDKIQLAGLPSNYSLGASPEGLPSGTGIFYLADDAVPELIGIVQNVSVSQLDLNNSNQFVFV